MEWKLTKEDGRPLTKNMKLYETRHEIECLVKKSNTHQPIIMNYNAEREGWIDYNTSESIPFECVEKWQYISDIDDVLEGKPESMWCWEFGLSLAKTAIPALERWIEKGVSYKYGMTPEDWKELFTKIQRGFEVSMSDLDGDLDDIIDLEERKRILEEHDAIRKEAFALMAEYYLDLWD